MKAFLSLLKNLAAAFEGEAVVRAVEQPLRFHVDGGRISVAYRGFPVLVEGPSGELEWVEVEDDPFSPSREEVERALEGFFRGDGKHYVVVPGRVIEGGKVFSPIGKVGGGR